MTRRKERQERRGVSPCAPRLDAVQASARDDEVAECSRRHPGVKKPLQALECQSLESGKRRARRNEGRTFAFPHSTTVPWLTRYASVKLNAAAVSSRRRSPLGSTQFSRSLMIHRRQLRDEEARSATRGHRRLPRESPAREEGLREEHVDARQDGKDGQCVGEGGQDHWVRLGRHAVEERPHALVHRVRQGSEHEDRDNEAEGKAVCPTEAAKVRDG